MARGVSTDNETITGVPFEQTYRAWQLEHYSAEDWTEYYARQAGNHPRRELPEHGTESLLIPD